MTEHGDDRPGSRAGNDRPAPTAHDEAISTTESAADSKAASAARLFDIRRIIGALFALYGLILLVVGLVDGDEASDQAAGIDINVWTGLGMLAVGLLFLLWMWRSPLEPPEPADDAAGDGRAGDDRPGG
jgi:protein-S-isoprenylcysteine O-methyltransferase Ste14